MQPPTRCVRVSDFVFTPRPSTTFGLHSVDESAESSIRAASAMLVGDCGVGKTTLLWQFAVNAARSRLNVLFVAKRSKAFDHPPMLFASPKSASGNAKQQFDWLGTAGAEAADIDESSWQDALRRIKVRYLDTYADLRRYFGFAHMHPDPPPDVVVVDDYHSYFDLCDVQSAADDSETNQDVIGTTALVAEAGHFWAFKRRLQDEASTPNEVSTSLENEGDHTVPLPPERESRKRSGTSNVSQQQQQQQQLVAPLTGPSADCSPTLLLFGVSDDALNQNRTLQAALRYFTNNMQFRLRLALSTATIDSHHRSSDPVVQQVQLHTEEKKGSSCLTEATFADEPFKTRSEKHSQSAPAPAPAPAPSTSVLHLQLLTSGKVTFSPNQH